MGLDDDEGPVELSAASMAALKEFLAERESQQTQEKEEAQDPFRRGCRSEMSAQSARIRAIV